MMKASKFKMKLIKPVTDWLTPTCEDIAFLISKSIDTKLSLREKLQVRIHIIGCILCHRYREQLLKLEHLYKKSLNRLDEDEISEEERLSDEAYNRIKTNLTGDSAG